MADVSGSSGTGGAPGGGDQDTAGDICVVCLDPNDDDTACYSTACPLHVFHKDCLLPWLSKKRKCPTCRTPVTSLLMKSGESVALPALELQAQLTNMTAEQRQERDRHREELMSRILRLSVGIAPERLERLLEDSADDSDSDDTSSASSYESDSSLSDVNEDQHQLEQEERINRMRGIEERLALLNARVVRATGGEERARAEDEMEGGGDSSEKNDGDEESARTIHDNQPPEPVESSVPLGAVINRHDINPESLRQERPRVVGTWGPSHPAYDAVTRFNQPMSISLNQISQPRSGNSSVSFANANNVQLEQEGTGERRRRSEERVALLAEVVRATGCDKRASGEDERGGGDSSEESDSDDQPCSSTTKNNSVRGKRALRLSDEEGETKKRRRM